MVAPSNTRVHLTDGDIATLQEIARSAPYVNWDDPNLPPRFNTHVIQSLFYKNTGATFPGRIATQYLTDGYAVVPLAAALSDLKHNDRRKAVAAVVATVGRPFGTYLQHGFWMQHGVNYEAKEGRAQSPGLIPLHFDFDQATLPPEGIALFCHRPAAHGGGESLIYDYRPFLAGLSGKRKEHLEKTRFSYATLYNTNGIGQLFNPHPFITTYGLNERMMFRFNARAYDEMDSVGRSIVDELLPEFMANSVSVALNAGDLLLENQSAVLHGRLPLTPAPDGIRPDPAANRQLSQCYIRHERR